MTKELTPLEALNKIACAEIKEQYKASKNGFIYRVISDEYSKELDIIEKALKHYELMKNTRVIVVDKKISDNDLAKLKNQRMFVGSLEQCEIKPLFDEETQKKLEALEIINSKNVQVSYLKNCETLDDYNSIWGEKGFERRKLTQEEFDLLKEVLL